MEKGHDRISIDFCLQDLLGTVERRIEWACVKLNGNVCLLIRM